MEKILILDFGSQTTALIGRRIREAGVYCEIINGDAKLTDAVLEDVKGIILSGSPESVYAAGAAPDKRVYECGLPLLGICYGFQRMTADLGGKVEALPAKEYGGVAVRLSESAELDALFKENAGAKIFLSSLPREFISWMSHGDTVTALAPDFAVCAKSASGATAIASHRIKPWFGLQFHPEVSHCECGNTLLSAFVFGVCACSKNWSMEAYIEEKRREISGAVGRKPVMLLISGGVDSTVAGALLLKTLPAKQVYLLYIDTGLMRKGETAEVEQSLRLLGAENLFIINAENEFLSALKGKTEPEEKRRVIGDLFIKIQEREVGRLSLGDDYFLAQGTLYTDLIESGKGVGKKARLIKSHHNVASPLVEEKRKAGKIIEPLDKLYKDEVRSLGRLLGVRGEVVRRHPFPGPGLGVRVLGEVTKEKCDILREADAIFINELKRRTNPANGKSLYDDMWQAFSVLLPVRSVGVAGDERKYGFVLALRAVASADGMTADIYPFNAKDLAEISTLITNGAGEIGRVTYDISSKPPATIEWE